MYEAKATYYPNQTLTIQKLKSGLIKTKNIEIYEQSCRGKVICKFDLLYFLQDICGQNMLKGREYVFSFLANDDLTLNEFKAMFQSFYKRFSTFTNYVNTQYYLGDINKKLIERTLQPIYARIDEARLSIASYGGKYLGENDGFIYFAFPEDKLPSNMKGLVCTYA